MVLLFGQNTLNKNFMSHPLPGDFDLGGSVIIPLEHMQVTACVT